MRKKVACIILGTSKNIDRLHVLTAGAIKSTKHDVFMKFVSDGPRPDFIPQEWEWISADHVQVQNKSAHPTSRRHAWALEHGIASADYDYCIFCDDDVIIDVDKFCDLAKQEDGKPACWITTPGIDLCIWGHVHDLAAKHFPGFDLCHIFLAGCVAVVSREFIELSSSHKNIWHGKLQDWSDEVGTPDIAICLLAGLLKVKTIKGSDWGDSGGTGRPSLICSSVLCKTGDRWFVHGTFRRTLHVNADSLQKSILKAPMNVDDLISTLYYSLKRGFKAKNFVGKDLDLKMYWCPWHLEHQTGCQFGYNVIYRTIQLMDDGSITECLSDKSMKVSGSWKACEDGFIAEIEGMVPHIYKWTFNGNPVGYPTITPNSDYWGHLVQLVCEQ